MFRTVINEEYRFFETEKEAIETIKNIFSSETCIFQKVTNWTTVSKKGNSSCQVMFVIIKDGQAKTFSKSILWLDAFKKEREARRKEVEEEKTRLAKEWDEVTENIKKYLTNKR